MSGIWYMLRDAERYVYHYTRPSTLTEFILPQQTLRLSPFHALNDPRETKNLRINGAAWADDLPPTILDDFAKELKRRWRVVCFVSDPSDAIFGTDDLLGAKQLQAMHERGHSRPRMWAQYAENHSGACLVFDKQSLANAFDAAGRALNLQVFSGRVVYENTPVVSKLALGPFTANMNEVRRYGLKGAAQRHSLRYWRELFLTKNTDWHAEREFRWLLYGESDREVFVNVAGCLRGVLLGSSFPQKLELKARRETHALNVEIARMDWSNGIPQIQLMLPLARGPQHSSLGLGSRLRRVLDDVRGFACRRSV